MKEKTKRAKSKPEYSNRLGNAIFWLSVGLLFLVPLAFSTSVQAIYSLPKFVLLLVGASVVALLLTIYVSRNFQLLVPLFKSNHVKLVGLYFVVVALSTVFSVAPLVSVFGSSSFMGLITRLCFFICFFGLIAGLGTSEERLRKALWAMVISGGLVAAYAVAQFVGIEPFVPLSVYTFPSSVGSVIRVCSSLGHSNYLGNFLLYIAPLSAGLALVSKGGARLLAVIIAVLSLTAILLSGVRGAWVGILVGVMVFVLLEWKSAMKGEMLANRRLLMRATAGALAILLLAIGVVVFSPASRGLSERVQTLRREGLASSGRLVLWRDALKMVPSYALIGCGPEGFRKAFLAYKSKELARVSPKANNESPHNAYLESALSHGLAGAALYVMMIVSTLLLLARTRRQAPSSNGRVVSTCLIASFAAVLAHNFFIFDQLTTGLYFFAFVALAAVAANVSSTHTVAPAPAASSQAPLKKPQAKREGLWWAGQGLTAVTGLLLLVAIWYAIGLLKADVAAKERFAPTITNSFERFVQQGEYITDSPLPTGAYHLLFARALDTYARALASQSPAKGASQASNDAAEVRQRALQLAIQYAEKSLAHTNTPDINYSLLASLALTTGDLDTLNRAATEAVRWDPNNYYTRWLMAEAHLARGEREQAAREAEIALDLYPVSPEAASVLARARGEASTEVEISAAQRRSLKMKRSVEELIQVARELSQAGKLKKARIKLLTTLANTDGNCADCHRELAVVYEKMGRYADAVVEWEAFLTLTSEPALVEQTKAHIIVLQQKPDLKP
jgi:putative inorganic carbon (hco3(-)) transporter